MGKAKHEPSFSDSWWPEILAGLLSTVTFIGALIFLSRVQEKATFHWHQITPNAVLSAFSIASRALLLFAVAECIGQLRWNRYMGKDHRLRDFEILDSASRGAWGSLQALWLTRSRALVALGAWITILSLFFDLSVQLVIGLDTSLVYSGTTNVTIASAQRWSEGVEVDAAMILINGTDGLLHTLKTPILGYSMEAAFASGLTDNAKAINQRTPVSCPSGNCRFDEFNALSVCSVCTDITNMLQKYTQRFGIPTYQQFAIADNENPVVSSQELFCQGIPDVLTICNDPGFTDEAEHPPVALLANRSTNFHSDSISHQNMSTMLGNFLILKAQSNQDGTWQNFKDVTVSAIECALKLCVRKYTSSVINGTLVETSVEVDSWVDEASWQLDNNNVTGNQFTDNPDTSKPPYVPTEDVPVGNSLYDPRGWFKRYDLLLKVDDVNAPHQNLSAFNISQAGVDSIVAFLNQSLSGGVVPAEYSASGYTSQSTVLQPLWDSANLQDTMNNVAISMSSAMRATSDNNLTSSGYVGVYKTTIDVRWPFIILPCICILSGLVFICLTIYDTKHRQAPLWKTSVLAVFYHGLEPSRAQSNQPEPLPSGMQAVAKRTTVRFRHPYFFGLDADRGNDHAANTDANGQELQHLSPAKPAFYSSVYPRSTGYTALDG